MPETTRRRVGYVTFPEAPASEEMIAAVLVTRDDEGTVRAYTKDVPGIEQPDPEVVSLLAQAASTANLPTTDQE